MTTKRILVSGLFAVLPVAAAHADEYADTGTYETPGMYSYGWEEPRLMTKIGVGVNIGGGFSGFTGDTMRDTVDSDVGGAWTARVSIGTHIPLGLDITYVGTAVDISPAGSFQTGTLIGTDVEGAVRWNILPHYAWNPYVFIGAGWQNYQITDANFSQAATGLSDSDNLAVFPMGGGFSYRDLSGITFDLRGTFRLATESDLLIRANGEDANLDTWEASGQIGYEF